MPRMSNPRTTSRTRSRRPKRRVGPQDNQLLLDRLANRNVEGGPRLPPINNDTQSMCVVRGFDAGTFSTSLIADAFAQYSTTLSGLPNASEFTTLFDQYRIRRVEFTFWPNQSVANSAAAESGPIVSVVDYDDSSALTSVAQALQYGNALTHSPYRPFTVSYKPHIATAAYSGAFTSYMNMKDQWIDSSSPAVIHYGLKVVALQSTGAIQSWRVLGKAVVELKNVR